MQNRDLIITGFIWLWVIGISVAYLLQFSNYFAAILKVLGVK